MLPLVELPVADRERLVAVLTRAAKFGVYFEADLEGCSTTELDFPSTLTQVCHRLGTAEARVAASSLQYEFAERLWSVALGSWAFGRVIPDLESMCYRATSEGSLVLGFTELRGWNCVGASPEMVAKLLSHLVISRLTGFHQALRAQVKIADGLLWGNAATALVLTSRSASRARSCTAVASALLSEPPLAGRITGPVTGPIRRRSCCLFYRTGARRTCSDCPLPESAAAWLSGERR